MASKPKLRRQELLPPFSEDDHGNYLTKIHDRLSGIKEKMRATIEDNLALYMDTLDHTTQLSHQVGRVSRELDSIRSRVSDPENSLFAVVINTTKRRRALADSERHTGVLIKVLESLVHVKRELDTLHALIQQRKLVSSIKQRILVSHLISTLPGAYAPGNEPIIYGTIKQRFGKLSQDLAEILQGVFAASFRFDAKNMSFSVTVSSYEVANSLEVDEMSHNPPLSITLAMLHAMDLAEGCIDRLASSLLSFVDSFLVEPSKAVPLPTLEVSALRNEATLSIKPSTTQNTRLHDIATSLGTAVSFFLFLTNHIINPLQHESTKLQSIVNPDVSFEETKASVSDLCLRLGSVLLPHIVDRLVSRCFEPSIPEHRSELKTYQRDVEAQMDHFVPLLSDFAWLPSKDMGNDSETPRSRPSEAWNNKLFDFLKSAHLHFGNKKKHLVLSRVRSLLLSGQYTSRIMGELEFGGADLNQFASSDVPMTAPLFKFPECRVREVIIELMQIAEDLMAEAFYVEDSKAPGQNGALLSPGEIRLRAVLLETVKDIFDLYRSIIPSYEQSKIAHIPQLSMLFHNDCQYMAHRITLMSARYRIQLSQLKEDVLEPPSPTISSATAPPQASSSSQPQSSRGSRQLRKATSSALPVPDHHSGAQNFTLIDLVTAFRTMAEKFYNDIVAALREQLQVLLENTDRLKDTHHEDRKKKALVVMRHIVNELENKDRMWSDTLPRELHKVTMGQLVNEVAEWMIDAALAASDFTADETESLHIIFLAIFPLAKIFVDVSDSMTTEPKTTGTSTGLSKALDRPPSSSTSVASSSSHSAEQASITKASCARYVKSWLRFEELTDAFRMPMIEIVERFNNGELHFTRTEVQGLIEACFEASQKRADRIASLRMDAP
jgi:hypothetical protein